MKWYENIGKDSAIVLYSKVTLSRNLAAYPFPCKLSGVEKEQLNAMIKDALSGEDMSFIEMKDLSKYELVSLAEKHLITPEFASGAMGRALLLSKNEDVSVMLQEEDHIKISAILPGLSAEEAFESATVYDEKAEAAFDMAFSEKLGYLTQNPANIGTGLRVSVMLHLPALNSKGEVSRLSSTVSKLGMALKSAYSERGHATGDLFILSNQVTLGITEDAAIKNTSLIASQIVAQERAAREEIGENEIVLDKIYRALGTLKFARLLTASETAALLSLVRLGSDIGVLDIDIRVLTDLFVNMQSATLKAKYSDEKSVNAKRAELVRTMLS